jgi:hypothetical protein
MSKKNAELSLGLKSSAEIVARFGRERGRPRPQKAGKTPALLNVK